MGVQRRGVLKATKGGLACEVMIPFRGQLKREVDGELVHAGVLSWSGSVGDVGAVLFRCIAGSLLTLSCCYRGSRLRIRVHRSKHPASSGATGPPRWILFAAFEALGERHDVGAQLGHFF